LSFGPFPHSTVAGQKQQTEEDGEKTSNNNDANENPAVILIATELTPDQQQLVANCEEAQANQDNLQQQLEEMEQQ
jgi:hypothetical protein